MKKIQMLMISCLSLSITLAGCSTSWKVGVLEKEPALAKELMCNKLDQNEIQLTADGYYDLRCKIVSKENIVSLNDDIENIAYNSMLDTQTKWEIQPKDFDLEKLLETGKQAGLHVKSLHEQGITGKNVGIAIIDQPLLYNHEELKDRVKLYKSFSEKDQQASVSGIITSSIALGKTTGVAPEANLFYVSDQNVKSAELNGNVDQETLIENSDFTHFAEDINNLVKLSDTLDENEKIRVISISTGYFPEDNMVYKKSKGADEMSEAIANAKKSGITVLCISPDNPIAQFQGITKKPYGTGDKIEDYEIKNAEITALEQFLFVPTNGITYASNIGYQDYGYSSNGGPGFVVPYVAGLYALACQVKPEITFEEFVQLADKTSQKLPVSNGKVVKIVDIEGIIKELENK